MGRAGSIPSDDEAAVRTEITLGGNRHRSGMAVAMRELGVCSPSEFAKSTIPGDEGFEHVRDKRRHVFELN